MKKALSFDLFCLKCLSGAFAQGKVLPPELTNKTCPTKCSGRKKRQRRCVRLFNSAKELILLRKGLNELICLTDDPSQPGFSVACYHKDLEPFMQRGRELRKSGKTFEEIFAEREKEVKAGTLKMPDHPTTLSVYSASREDYNEATGEVKKGYLRSVIYIPYATPAKYWFTSET